MDIAVTCHTCGKEWTPDRDDYVRGLWKTCPTCRPGGREAQGIKPHDDPAQRRTGAHSASGETNGREDDR